MEEYKFKKHNIMETTLLLTIVLIAVALTVNVDLPILFKRLVLLINDSFDNFSKFLFGGQSNICRY